MRKKKYITKGDVAAQKKRRKERRKLLPEREKEGYMLIDNNISHYPVAYCRYHKGWLSIGLLQTHNCRGKGCMHLIERKKKETVPSEHKAEPKFNSECAYFTLSDNIPVCDIKMDLTFCSKNCAFASNNLGRTKVK